MPASLSTMLKKLDLVSEVNRITLKDFYQYIQLKDLKSEHHIINLLNLLIFLDKFYGPLPFTSINNKEQVLTFLNHRYSQKEGKWVEREHDLEGKYISSFNQNKRLLSVFFRWLTNRDKSEDDWETPPFLKFKSKKPLRDSPYGVSDIWELDDVLTIVSYEPELRNQAIVTLLWDLDARNHEITALRIRDIILDEQYGEGNIPSNTKTGGGPILLTSSFTYVRDWINKHPFKNEPDARLICNLYTGSPIRPDTIWQVLDQLRDRIKRLVESGPIENDQKKQKLEYLLRVKKWNPYCFRHSAITDDSDHLPEYALKKKVRWVMNSQQGNRYIKNRMGDELKNKILERHGIKITTSVKQMVSRTCGRCGHVNRLESKYCENSAKGCNYPLTQEALDEIKSREQANLQELIDKSNLAKEQEIDELKNQINEMDGIMNEVVPAMKEVRNELDGYKKELGLYREQYSGRHLTKEERKRLEEFRQQMDTLPDNDILSS